MPIDLSDIRPDTIYSVSEAARVLGQTAQTIRIHLNDGDLKGSQGKNGRWKIPGREIIRYVNSK
jgi:predicted site-specific integrase-resolvase